MGDDYADITTGIASGSLSLDEVIQSGNLNLGEINSNEFEVQMYSISDVSNQRIKVWQIDDDDPDTTIPIFVGYVDSCKQDTQGAYRDIVAYDVFYKLNGLEVAGWWEEFWNDKQYYGLDTATLYELRTSLITYVNALYPLEEAATVADGDMLNDDIVITKPSDAASIKFVDMFKYICELQAVIPNINREGKLEFIRLDNYVESIDISEKVNTSTSTFEEYETATIDAVWIYDASPTVVGIGGAGTTNPYRLQGNVLAYGIQNTDDRNSVADAIYSVIDGIKYTPVNINLIQTDVTLLCGQKIAFSDRQGVTHTSYIFETTLSGSLFVAEELIANGDQYLTESVSTSTSFTELKKIVEAGQFYVRTFTNADAVTINESQGVILVTQISTTDSTTVVFVCEVPFHLTFSDGATSAKITVSYTYNGEDIGYYPVEVYDRGVLLTTEEKTFLAYDEEENITTETVEVTIPAYSSETEDHLIHLLYVIPTNSAMLVQWNVLMNIEGGGIVIDKKTIQAVTLGTGLVGQGKWDGTISFTETAEIVSIPFITFDKTSANDSVIISTQIPTAISLTESATAKQIPFISFDKSGVTDELAVNPVRTNWTWTTSDEATYSSTYVTTGDTGYILQTSYTVSGTEGEIDTGYLTSITPLEDTTVQGLESVEDVEIK